uniref:Axin-1 n=1 Tax=Poecilia latipinna TaxID=48699 RepID=A0A3B3UUH0_9TELE
MDAGTMSISDQRGFISDLGGSFTEDAPRPPVPGEEGELVCGDGRQHGNLTFSSKNEGAKSEAYAATPRRSDLDLGYEPEGSASPTPPYLKWAESLHSLLDDQDGILLFGKFLRQEDCADMLDFWFACSGFRKLEASEGNEEKKVKLAKAIYKKYIQDNNGIVSRQIKPATKSFIRDCLMRLHIDPAMFDQAQTEIQSRMEENTYPLFLKSDIYLEYTRTGGESPKLCSDRSSVSGNEKGLSGYLPTLNEYEGPEETERDLTPSSQLTQKLLMETVPQQAASSAKFQDSQEPGACRESINPYYVNIGHVLAPATSANDSEQQSISSDAETLSLTDSSVNGVPPYRYRKQHRREMHESAKANGRVPLPHFPRTNRIPKDIHVEPERFAAELIKRLEGVLREREAEEKLEERLKRVRLEEEGDEESSPSSLPSQRFPPSAYSLNYNPCYADITYSSPFVQDAHEENPESILDDHVQRVMKTPVCESPGTGRHSPKSRSPDGFSGVRGVAQSGQGKHSARHGVKGETSHAYHHKYVPHSHTTAVDPEGATRTHGNPAWNLETSYYGSKSRSYADGMTSNPCKRAFKRGEEARAYDAPRPVEEVEKKQKILLWLMEGQKEMAQQKRSPYGSVSGSKKTANHEGSRLGSSDRSGSMHPCLGGQGRSSVQPFHPFIQDPTMPPNPAPSPLIQLEEVCRRLEEEKSRGLKPSRQTTKKQPCENITVAYYFCEELIPYRTSVRGRVVTLGQFKELLTKKGNYRYYFKKVSDEFDCGVVFEEIREDDAVLPIFEEKIIGKVEKVD